MSNEKQELKQWIKDHKKELAIAGFGVLTLIALVIGFKRKDALMAFWRFLKSLVVGTGGIVAAVAINDDESETVSTTVVDNDMEDVVDEGILKGAEVIVNFIKGANSENIAGGKKAPHSVMLHVRNLPPELHPSLDKIRQAEEMGIHLEPGQTWVMSYQTGVA